MFLANATGDAVISYVGEFILGGIAVLALTVAYWAINQMKLAKDQTISALNEAANRKEQASDKHADAYQRTATATVRAIEKLTAAESAQTVAIIENTRAVTDLRTVVGEQRTTIDSVVRDAVRRGGRSGDRWPAQPPPTKAPR